MLPIGLHGNKTMFYITFQDEKAKTVEKLEGELTKLKGDHDTLWEEMKYFSRRNEELSHIDEECQGNKAKINQLEGELNTLREELSTLHAQKIKGSPINPSPPGELQDINPAAVIVRQPALNGTSASMQVL